MNVLTPSLRVLLTVASAFVIVGGLRYAGSFLLPVVLAFFLAVINAPFVTWLHHKGLPHVLSILVTLGVNLAVIGLFVSLTVDEMLSFLPEAPRYVTTITEAMTDRADKVFDNPILTKTEQLQESKENFSEMLRSLAQQFTYELPTGNQVLDAAASLTGTIFFVFIVMIFMMSESLFARRRVENVHQVNGPNLAVLERLASDIQRYLLIKTSVSLATGLLAWLLTWSFGLEFPLLWGILAFALNYIPSIGSIIAAIPPCLLALAELSFFETACIAAGYLCINMSLGNFIEPMLLGRRFGISTLVVILSALFWGWVWGPLGMFVAIPLTMMLKMMLDHSDELRWLGVAMEKITPEESDPASEPVPLASDDSNESSSVRSPHS